MVTVLPVLDCNKYIETQSEFEKLIELGVDYGQGFFVQKPSRQVYNVSDIILKIIKLSNDIKNNSLISRASNISIQYIAKPAFTLTPNITVMEVENTMKTNHVVTECCILKNDEVIGRDCFHKIKMQRISRQQCFDCKQES